MSLTRRRFLSLAAAAAVPVAARRDATAAAGAPARLAAAPARVRVVGPDAPETPVWAYDATVPGPVLRLRRGETFDVEFENRLDAPTTVHWHGLRVPNAMDGVPHLTQAPIAPGERFRYTFEVRDSGTFWYHPHFRSDEQVDRGLHGAIVVAEDAPPEVDRDLVWVLDDWRLDGKAQIVEDFGDLHDASHQGRFGNTAMVNGTVPGDFAVRAGERVRLRLVNVANAWIFGLDFTGHAPRVIALDGHAVEPHRPGDGLVVVAPSQRVDVILDCTGNPGARFEVTDRFYPRNAHKLTDLAYADAPALRATTAASPIAIAPPDFPEADLARAERHEVRFTGGAMGGMASASYQGRETGIRELARRGKVWAVNGVVAGAHDEPAFLRLGLGRSYVLDFVNDTAFHHPVHLHGHPMRVLSIDGREVPRRTWRDTVLVAPRTRATVAVVADNPGRWMLHCHIPEHQEAGMMAVVEVG